MAKVLVVDDEPGMRQVVLNVLKTEGHELFSAEDGKQAIELAKNESPVLVMLDMRLPDMDGLEILAEIKKMLPNTQVIMLSGFGDVESVRVGRRFERVRRLIQIWLGSASRGRAVRRESITRPAVEVAKQGEETKWHRGHGRAGSGKS